MTTLSLTQALEAYRQYPLDDGDAVLLLPDDGDCLELGPLPGPSDLRALAQTLPGRTVLLAVARRGRRPQPDDLLLWAALDGALRRSGSTLLPLELLPAAT